jgi:hypothetical protein
MSAPSRRRLGPAMKGEGLAGMRDTLHALASWAASTQPRKRPHAPPGLPVDSALSRRGRRLASISGHFGISIDGRRRFKEEWPPSVWRLL